MNYFPSFNPIKVITYPLSFSSLFLLVFTSFFITGALTDIFIAVLGSLGIGLFLIWFFKYAFSSLIYTAEGHSEAPLFSDTHIRSFEDFRYVKLAIILMINFLIIHYISDINTVIVMAYKLLFIMLIPAVTCELAMENSFLKAINLLVLLEIIKKSGVVYFVFVAAYIPTYFILIDFYESGAWLFIKIFLTLYLILISFHICGLILFTRRKQMGYVTSHSPEQIENILSDKKLNLYQRIADNIYSQHKQNNTIYYLERTLKNEPLSAYDWFFTEIISWHIKPKFKRLFNELYCRKYCESGNIKKALNHYINYKRIDSEFYIADEETRKTLQNIARLQKLNINI